MFEIHHRPGFARRRLPSGTFLASTVCLSALCLSVPAFSAQRGDDVCAAGTTQIFSATGTSQTYFVPAGYGALQIAATGASGGQAFGGVGTRGAWLGGNGAVIEAQVPLGAASVVVIVGEEGISGTDINLDRGGFGGGGGGGGSLVYSDMGTLLVAAGGGGGAGITEDADDAQLGEDGSGGGGTSGGTGGTAGSGGGAAFPNIRGESYAAGGGGFFSAGGSSISGAVGGDRISPPGTAAGGAGVDGGGAGGFGGGGGASSVGGGGGGGYSGGGGGFGEGVDGGGGGGSFIAAFGTLDVSSISDIAGDGAVVICARADSLDGGGTNVLEIPTTGTLGLGLLALLLGGLAVFFLRRT